MTGPDVNRKVETNNVVAWSGKLKTEENPLSKQHPLVVYVGDNCAAIEPHVFYMYTITAAVEILAILGLHTPDAVIINQSHPLSNEVLELLNTRNWQRTHTILISECICYASENISRVQSESEAIEVLMERLHGKMPEDA